MKRDLEISTDIHMLETEVAKKDLGVVATLGADPVFPRVFQTGDVDIRILARHEDVAVAMDR
ncbi:hypothetical protein D3C80_1757990 [compost metagenome]